MEDLTEMQTLPYWRIAVIYPTMILYMSGMSMVDYSVNEYTQSVIKEETFPNATFTNVTECRTSNITSQEYMNYANVQKITSNWIIYYALAIRIPSIILNTVLTSYTDVYGRRCLFIYSIFGSELSLVLITVVIHFKLGLFYIVIAHGVQGLSGSFYSFLSVTFSFMADTTNTVSQRLFAVTVVEAFVLTFSVAGGLSNGFLVDQFGFVVPMVVCSGLCILALLIVIFFLPESHQLSNRSSPTTLVKTFARTINFYTSSEFTGKRMSFILLLTAFFFIELTANNRSTIETLYLLGMPFCWKPTEIGYFTSLRYAAQGIFGLGLLKLFGKCFTSERLAILSCLANAGSFVQEALAKTDIALFLVAVPSIFSFLTIPLIRCLMSTSTLADKQGSLFAGIATVEITSALVATVSESSVYAATVAVSNSFVFFVMAGFCLITACLLSIDACTKRKHSPKRMEYEVIEEVN